MEELIPQNILTFQFTNWYDRNNLEFTERVTQHLRESIYPLMDETDIPKNTTESIILGDIISEKFLSSESRHFVYFLEDYNAVDEIINQLNIDFFGEDLSDPEIDIVVKFVYALNIKN